jgi:hypothetical protein
LDRTYTRTLEPTRALAAETLHLERTLSDLVNQACALTPAKIDLMWQTAPPRMPIPQPLGMREVPISLAECWCQRRLASAARRCDRAAWISVSTSASVSGGRFHAARRSAAASN